MERTTAADEDSKSPANSQTQPLSHFAFQAAFATAIHPMTVAKVLIQIGHEPMAPEPSRSIFGNPVVHYPNTLRYIWHIRKTDGFLGLYRGLGARLCSGVVSTVVTNHASWHLAEAYGIKDQEPSSKEDVLEGLYRVLRESTHESVSRCLGTIASHPFQVICVRSIAQYVGQETLYSWIFGSIREIYQEEGIMGFFAGIVPRIIGDVSTIFCVNFLVHLVNKYLIPDAENVPKELKTYSNVVVGMLVSQFMYPFTVVSSCMAVNKSRLAAGNPPFMPIYDSWRQCYSELSAMKEIKRGSGMFFRPYNDPAILRHDGKPMPAPASF